VESFNSRQKTVKKGIGLVRLPTASASPAARLVSCVIMENRHVIIDQLQLATSVRYATIHAIILEDLKTKKCCANLVARDLLPNEGREGYLITGSCLLVTTRTRLILCQTETGYWLLVLDSGFTFKLWR
jgi:hypothetical protein